MRNSNNDALSAYFASIANFPILSEEETKDLAIKAQSGDKEASDTIINCNLKLAAKLAKNYIRPGFEWLDAIYYANDGLMEAVKKWSPTNGTKFQSYATRLMATKLRDGTRSERLQPISDYAWRDITQIRKARAEYYQQYECEPNEWDLSDMLGGKFTPEKVRDLLDWSYDPDSFDSQMGDDDDSLSLEDVTGYEDEYDIY